MEAPSQSECVCGLESPMGLTQLEELLSHGFPSSGGLSPMIALSAKPLAPEVHVESCCLRINVDA
jgi:hypothetical protein